MSDKARKSKATLDKLDESQQLDIFAKIESGTLAAARDYLKSEYDIEISENRLSQWAMKRRFQVNLSARVELLLRARNNADELVKKIGDSATIDKANLALLGQSFLDAQVEGNQEVVKHFGSLYAGVTKAVAAGERVDVAVQALELERERIKDAKEKFRVSLLKKLELAMDSLKSEIKSNPKALTAFTAMQEALAQ